MEETRPADRTRKLLRIKLTLGNCWGEKEYEVRFHRMSGEDWPKPVFWFLPLDGQGKSYRVEHRAGRACCSCPDQEGHQLPGQCKHVGALRHLLSYLEDLWEGNHVD